MTLTNISSWPYSLALTFTAGGFILVFINIGIKLYISHKYLTPLLNALPKSPYAQSISRNISQGSTSSRSLTFSLVAGLILFKKAFIRTGDLCQSDIDRFPKRLEKVIKLEFIFSIITLSWIILIGILFKIQEVSTE